jgi:molybdopterin-containing oxidoreductase family iron-sulfur binding subunit
MTTDLTRRQFLRGGAPAAPVEPATLEAAAPTKPLHRWGMVIDLDRCTACSSCTIACRQENNIPAVGPDAAHDGAQIEWMSMLWREPEEAGGLPEAMPFPCQHCTDAPCVKVCPVGATYKSPEGITMQIWERCIGCRYCMVACPYGRRSFNWDEPEWPGTLGQMLNPDVATRPGGVVEKCTFCHHRIRNVVENAQAEGRPVRDDEMKRLTACAAACPAEAITFGDLADPTTAVAEQARSSRRFRLLDHLGTEPGVIYLERDRR